MNDEEKVVMLSQPKEMTIRFHLCFARTDKLLPKKTNCLRVCVLVLNEYLCGRGACVCVLCDTGGGGGVYLYALKERGLMK